MLHKNFDFKSCENRIYATWLKDQIFDSDAASGNKTFCIMMPPPNITGTLHVGHALSYTLQDILIRYKRMQGYDVLWQPGVDHAGIATQAVIERQLTAEDLTRQQIGRNQFMDRVWQWKDQSGGRIVEQQRRLGLSPDWSRQCFTMDDQLSHAVQTAFIKMYQNNLIYRDKRLVNWDPKLLTAISDIEVKSVETKGHYWYLRYPIEGSEGQYLVIATSRPETLFGDTAVAVNPDDIRYQHLIGKTVILPLVGRRITIIADDYSDPEKGSGAVKITPAHDFNDFQIGKRHNLEFINIFTPNAHLNDNVPELYRGLDRMAARVKVIEDLTAAGLIEKIDSAVLMLPYGDRSNVIIEPYLTDQWFVKTDVMAARALKAVSDGETQILPESACAVYNHWLNNIEPWCISRQLWWGHRIPAWYTPDGDIIVAASHDDACHQARAKFGRDIELHQDEDVLDTWFSSGIWPFSTLGWPERTPELKRYYPTSLLITGTDILFFWVARMMMMGLELMDEVPFKTVYLHALVRDEKGQKLSKSKGDQANIMDPLHLIDEYGADALRFTLASMASPGRDIRFSAQMVGVTRNFTTKIWNAARFLEHYQCRYEGEIQYDELTQTVNKWIVSELSSVKRQIEDALDHYHIDRAANLLYHFIWGRFCDWYLEIIKPLLSQTNAQVQAETRQTAAWVMRVICSLLHPYMPFITEEIARFIDSPSDDCSVSFVWPSTDHQHDANDAQEITWVIDVITAIRSLRNEFNISPSTVLQLSFGDGQSIYRQYLQVHAPILEKLARIQINHDKSDNTVSVNGRVQIIVSNVTLLIALSDILDLTVEQQRLCDIVIATHKEIRQIEAQLSNVEFREKAPPEIIQKNEKRLEEVQLRLHKTQSALSRISE